MESSTSSQPNQPYSPVNRINFDMDFEKLLFSQEYYPSQVYFMGHGSAAVNDDEEDDSPVEEVSPVKPKKPSRRAAKAKKNDPKEPPKEWIVEEDIALCQAWVRPRNGAFCAIINNVEENYESGAKKVQASETTSESASGGYNLNDEADEPVKVTQEVRPMGRDRSKGKKKSSASSHRWYWSLEGSHEFSVKSSRILIDNTILPKAEVPTKWLRVVPIKINVHALRVCLDRLPTRANLSLRGMDIQSIVCPLCNSAVESSSHIFFACPLARQVWRNFLIWWELEDVAFNSYNE
nr:RNA-directed DNA polymerase, eukaryota [Tanacetum cinerariifolium]